MSDSLSYLAIDLGASSGRSVVGTLDGGRVELAEVHRFQTPLVERDGHLFWDLDVLWRELEAGLQLALAMAPNLRAVSVDSWAVDYVPLGADGLALRDPYAYRDERTEGWMDRVHALIPAADLYGRTGIQFLPFNTIYQVAADLELEPEVAAQTETRLLIADYLLYRLSGRAIAERTMASTTALFNARTGDWDADLIRQLGDEPSRWPRVVEAGTVLGLLQSECLPDGFEGDPPMVVAACSHDTGAAVAAVPATGDQPWAYISSGTWSLVGLELAEAVLTDTAREANVTNEAGIDGTVRFLKNRTGFWVLEECIREWEEADGERPEYATLAAEAAAAPSLGQTVDLNEPQFGLRGGMLDKLSDALRQLDAPVPETRGGIVRLILESLAESTRQVLIELGTLTGQPVEVVHIVGGGVHNELLNQLTADACGLPVVAGPAEATALGTLLVQARALGDLGARSVRDVVRASTDLKTYTPTTSVSD
ncbi:MAG: rhamnulokinase family protein [Rubricoccaceae bacterium]